MKNKIVLVIIFFVLCFSSVTADAQYIHNRVSFYAGVLAEKFHGKEFVNEGNFTYPSLIANLTKSTGYNIKAFYKARKHFGLGIAFEERKAAGWKLEGRKNYTGSTIVLKTVAPTFQYRTRATALLGSGELKGVFELSPVVGVAKLSLSEPLFEIQNGPLPMDSSDDFFGVMGGIGFEFDFHQSFGLTGNYSYQYNSISPKLFVDKQFSSSRLSIGLFVKLIKDKHYFYR